MLTITISPELEVALTQRARQCGSTPEQIALDTLQRDLLPPVRDVEGKSAWAARLRQLASPSGVSLSEESLSRETMYA